MNAIKTAFGKDRVVLPVIHVKTRGQALINIAMARLCGADGVFLINHGISHTELSRTYQVAREAHPDLWIGVNLLSMSTLSLFPYVAENMPGLNGVWVDNARIDEANSEQLFADDVQAQRAAAEWKGLYFGGVAFKYQRAVQQRWLDKAAQAAMPYMEVVTTSGPGTAKAAQVGKIHRLRAGLGDHALAVASGITPSNVVDYLPYVNAFLVASGISKDWHNLDEQLTKELVKVVKTYGNYESNRQNPTR